MNSKSAIPIPVLLVSGILLHTAALGEENNVLQNHGFEKGLENWGKRISGNAQVEWEPVKDISHSGQYSVRVTNGTAQANHVWGALTQAVVVKPDRQYELSLWIRADSMKGIRFGKWRALEYCEGGTYDWRQYTLTYTTKSDETEFVFRILITGLTRAAWIDDIRMIEKPLVVTAKRVKLQNQRFRPLMYAAGRIRIDGSLDEWRDFAALTLPSHASQAVNSWETADHWKGKNDLSANVHLAYDEDKLYLGVEVLDDIHHAVEDAPIWHGDSVRIAFGTAGHFDHEYGFSRFDGKACIWYGSNVDDRKGKSHILLATSSDRQSVTYEASIPWQSICETVPQSQIGFNILVNDNDGAGTKGWIEWIPGLGAEKDAGAFGFLIPSGLKEKTAICLITEDRTMYKGKTEGLLFLMNLGNAAATYQAMVRVADENTVEKAIEVPPHSTMRLGFPVRFYTPGYHPITARVKDLNAGTEKRATFTIKVKDKDLGLTALEGAFDHLEKKLPELERLLDQCAAEKIPTDYEMVNYTVIKNFIVYGRDDIAHHDVPMDHNILDRAHYVARELEALYEQAIASLKAYIGGYATPLALSRFVTTKPRSEGFSFVADAADPVSGKKSKRPVTFIGYGHFGQIREDIPQFRGYGANIIQIAFSSRNTVTPPERPDELYHLSTELIEDDIQINLKKAEEHNVRVDLLLEAGGLSPWAVRKWREIQNYENDKFLPYLIDAPLARKLVKEHMQTVASMVKDYKSVHSICLTNEPQLFESRSDKYAQAQWQAYLENLYGDIDELNRIYREGYNAFEQIPIPDPSKVTPTPHFYDWARFNMDRFSQWHKWLADIVHEVAPEIPVHVKILDATFNRKFVSNGVDPEQFCGLSAFNGCDAAWYYKSTEDPYLGKLMFYDLLCSMVKAPVFNSEDHIIKVKNHDYIPELALHVRRDLWQGALHGRGASTMWVWERFNVPTTYEGPRAREGGILHRPDCVAATGKTCLDLNRLCWQVKAFQEAPANVAILYSVPSIVYSPAYTTAVKSVYKVLSLSGQKVGFISEQQMKQGGMQHKLLVIPEATHVLSSTILAVTEYMEQGGSVMIIGKDSLRKDEHDQRLARERRDYIFENCTFVESIPSAKEFRDDLLRILAEMRFDGVMLIDTDSNQPVWGVEWRTAEYNGKRLLNAVNYIRETRTVRIMSDGEQILNVRDLVREKSLPFPTYVLKPLEPFMVEY